MSRSWLRNWLRTTAMVIGGGAVMGGWIGLHREVRAEPIPSPNVKGSPKTSEEVPAVWTRSTTTTPVQNILKPKPMDAGPVVPASARIPAVRVDPPTFPIATPPSSSPGVPVPAIPEFKPVPIPTTPVVPAMPPVAIPAPIQTAPSAPPAKSADPVNPVIPTQPEFNLRPGDGGNSVKPEASIVPQVPALSPAPSEPSTTGLTGTRPKPMEVIIAPTVKDIYSIPGTVAPLPIPQPPPAPGVDIMNLQSRSTTIAAVTGIALAFAPVQSTASAQDKTDPVQLRKDLDAANKKLEEADKEIKRLAALLDGKKDEKGFRLETDPGAVEEVKRLKDRIAALEKQVAAMQNSTSFKPAPAITGKGTIRVVNEYPVAVSIVINEKSYRVEPNTTLNVEVPVGEFNYQLLQSGIGATPVRSTIKEKEVVTLRVK